MRLLDYFERHYRPARLIAAKRLSIENYRGAIRALEKSAGQTVSLADLSDTLLADLASACLARGCSRETASQYLRHLLPIWKHAHRAGVAAVAPSIRIPKNLVRLPRAWRPEEVGQILFAARGTRGWVSDIPARLFWPSLILTLYDTGARKNVILNLAPTDLDLERKLLRLPAEMQKGRREQVLPISDQTAAALAEMGAGDAAARRKWLFPWPADRYPRSTWRHFNRAFRRIVLAAGVDAEHGLCHRLRKTRATLGEMIEPGSATADLGHRSRSLTVDHYIDPTMLSQRSIVDRLPRPVEPAPRLGIFVS